MTKIGIGLIPKQEQEYTEDAKETDVNAKVVAAITSARENELMNNK